MRLLAGAMLIAGLLGLAFTSVAQDTAVPIGEPIPPYFVIFASDESNLTSSSKLALDQVVEDFKAGGITRLEVRGHYDRTGTPQHRIDLSRQYADAVRDYRLAAGVPAEVMSVTWAGDSEPSVPTADGVPEAANRIVVITPVLD